MRRMGFGNELRGVLVAALLWSFAPCVQAAVYACRGADGGTAYQDRPCADAQHERRIELAPAPPPAKSPDYRVPAPRAGAEAPARPHARARVLPAPAARKRGDDRGFECRADNGEVFYRLSACPRSIALDAGSRRATGAAKNSPVRALALPREEACRRMQRSGRSANARDDGVSAYERRQGRDPCRSL